MFKKDEEKATKKRVAETAVANYNDQLNELLKEALSLWAMSGLCAQVVEDEWAKKNGNDAFREALPMEEAKAMMRQSQILWRFHHDMTKELESLKKETACKP